MTVINTNVGAITARTYATNSSSSVEDNLEKLSSGRRVNSGSDDAAGLAVANKLEAQFRSTNMAINNASNGISLIQTAGSGMNKVNSMLVRIREISVQMANGIYTDQDRKNAQAEVSLLTEEIDKISENLQFNQVYLLDGSYKQSFRTGVANQEVFGLSIISQRSEELGKESGLKSFGTTINTSTHKDSFESVSINAKDANTISIDTDQLGSGLQTFLNNNPLATLEITGEDAAKFSVSQSGKIEGNNISFDPSSLSGNIYNFMITATNGASKFSNLIEFTLEENTTESIVKSSSSTLAAIESNNLSFRAVNSSNAEDGMLSLALQNFVQSDIGTGTFSISGGTDASHFQVNAISGLITSSIEYEAFNDANNDNIYSFELEYTSSTGDTFSETVNLQITDGQEEAVEYVMIMNPLNLPTRSRFSLQIDNQTLRTSVFAAGTYSFSDVANSLNAANSAMPNQVRASFNTSANGVTAVFNNEAGDVSNTLTSSAMEVEFEIATTVGGAGFVNVANAANATAYSKNYDELYGALNLAKTGDVFTYTYDGSTITSIVGTGVSAGDYSVADLASDMNEANSNSIPPLPINFASSGTQLKVSRSAAGELLVPPVFGDFTFKNNNLSSTGTSTAGTNQRDRQVTIDTSGWVFSASGDIPEITIDGELIIGNALPGAFGVAAETELANSLNTALASKGISVSETINPGPPYTSSITFTMSGMSSEAANAINFEKLEVWQPGLTASVAFNRTEALSEVSYSGASNNSAYGRDNSTFGNNTDGQTTNSLSSSNGMKTDESLKGTLSVINVEDDFTVSLKLDDLSDKLNTFVSDNPFGDFSLEGQDKAHFKIDAFDGTIKTTKLFKSEPKSSYNIVVSYTDKSGKLFQNEVNLIRDAVQNVAKDSVADVNISTSEGANSAITILDRAINQMAAQEATMGAAQNRLEYAINYLSMASLNTAASRGRVIDADFAEASSALAKAQILNQASTSVLVQANGSKRMLLALLN